MDETNNQQAEDDNEFSPYVKEFINKQNAQKNVSKKKKSKHSDTVIIILIFILIAAVAVIFTFNLFAPNKIATISLPKVSTSCISSADNSMHSINAQFTLSGNENEIKRIGQNTLYDDIYAAVSDLDYSQIPAVNSSEYVKEYVQGCLSSKYQNLEITEIYLTDFSTDEGTKIQKDDNTGNYDENANDRAGILNGISNWNN